LLAENVKDVIWTLDLRTLRFTYISPSVESMRGYTVEEAMSQTLDQALTPASLEIVTKALAEQLSPENLEQLGQFWSRTIETEQTLKAGPPKRFEVSVTFIRDLNGKPVELLGVTRDITERRMAEKLIRESERKYRTLFEESRDVVFTATPEGRIADINPAGIELFGYSSREDILNVEIGQGTYVNPADRESYRKEMEERGFVKDHELVLKTKDGKQLFVLVTANAVRDDQGRIAAYKGIMRDITDKKQLEHQLIQAQKMESIGTLAGGIAHDFNNLLAGILGYASLTKTKIPSEHQVFHYIDTIEKSATRAAELTSQLLAFAR
jgi:PAS domain S-box-containing protein